MNTIKELTELRETYGHDDKAINRHSIRVYEYRGIQFMLDRTLDGVPPFFTLWRVPVGGIGICNTITVNNKEYWGDGITWQEAERLAFEAIPDHFERTVRR